ncbi:MAG TPA: ribose 5-phosphate isomerase A [Candidatus Erysipelatoclostridium merdavium]|uniref:Ribose 5-phosphate isomerase A n=1 Tax=Candidatus Erysipelatoclostridium merdavium TaxID=2838566 RepID=A0A9D1XNJ5_9FIRM|nr:ribose 5-phosphate isomerase A [Candidatus Erysipelatoclostridium merdavium]
MKERCALTALKYIKPGMVVGLGGGSTISYLVKFIKEENIDIKVVTPSFQTAKCCIENGLNLIPAWSIDHIDIAFDGCDEVDLSLNALKSGGAIHTKEKIIASMADEYVLLVDESKVFEKLLFNHPITLEVVLEAMNYVKKEVSLLGGQVDIRKSSAKDGYTVSDHGNVIMEAKFDHVDDIKQLNKNLNQITGIIDTSLFTGIASMAISVDDLHVRVIKGGNK